MACCCEFAKGHGTRNDFVLFADPDNLLDLTAEQVTFLCDRRAGIGGDGILRAVRANQVPEWTGVRDVWFMDYRNADGSIAEMCGNGAAGVPALPRRGGAGRPAEQVAVGTRAGLRTGRFLADGRIAVTMGPATRGGDVRLTVGGESWAATSVDVGNPHAVSSSWPHDAELDALDLTVAPHLGAGGRVPERRERRVRRPRGARPRSGCASTSAALARPESCGTGVVAAAAGGGGATTARSRSRRRRRPGGATCPIRRRS